MRLFGGECSVSSVRSMVPQNTAPVIDPRSFRSFCFRGEGRANFVISAKCEKTGLRCVFHSYCFLKHSVFSILYIINFMNLLKGLHYKNLVLNFVNEEKWRFL